MNRILILLLGTLPIRLVAQERPFTITGDLGAGKNYMVQLLQFTVSTGQKKDSVRAVNGKFKFKGMVNSERQLGQIIIPEKAGPHSIVFYLEPGNIKLSWPDGDKHYKVGGTALNKDLQEFRAMMNKVIDSINAAGGDAYEYSPRFWPIRFDLVKKFVERHPGSAVGLDQLNMYAIGHNQPASIEAVYKMMRPEIQKSEKGIELANRIKGMRSGEVGDIATNFSIADTAGKIVSLSDFKGKYVLIDFWATWCIPCIAEFPYLRKAYSDYSEKNFEILGVSLDRPDSKERWLKMISEEKLVWKQVSDLKWWYSDAAFLYNVNSVPANFLVDPNGKIIAKNLRREALEKKLAEILH